MKRLFVTALITCPIASLLLTASPVKHCESIGYTERAIYLPPDSSDSELPVKIESFNFEIVPPSSGIQFYKDGFVFLSHSKKEDRMITDHVSFGTLNTYYATLKDTTIGQHVIFSSSEPFPVPSESMTFSSDYSEMYYAKRPEDGESEKIYKAVIQSGKGASGWISEKDPLVFCSDNSTYTHPALSAAGDMMIFSSNRRGSSGAQDLYVTHKSGETWSSPENLGKSVNTNGNEIFPFLDKENNLYFSSDGYKGIGGYDIYFSRFNGKYWDKAVNLTKRINSPDDELALKINPKEGNTAFLSVRRKSESPAFKILRITFADPYSQNKYSGISNAFKYIAGIDVSPFKAPGLDSSLLAKAGTSQPAKPESVMDSGKKPVKQADATPEQGRKQAELKSNPKPEQVKEKTTTKPEILKPSEGQGTIPGSEEVIYRVQFLATSKSKGSYDINIGDNNYRTFEYMYNGLYRTCAGEFRDTGPAKNFQDQVKQAGYKDAFIVAFKNGQRVDLKSVEKAGQNYASASQINPPETVQPEADTRNKPEEKPETSKPAEISQSQAGADAIIYRVQILTSAKSQGSYNVTIGEKPYKTFEYLFNGAYRTCIGEFGTAASAKEFSRLVKQAGHQDAFVVVFKNDQRLMDPALLK